MKYNIKDSMLVFIYEALYDWERDIITGNEFLRRVMAKL